MFASADLEVYAADSLVEEFRRARQEAYSALAVDIERTLTRVASSRHRSRKRAFPIRRVLATYRERLSAIERIDFFGSAGRDRVTTLVEQIATHSPADRGKRAAQPGADGIDRERYRSRLWITRPRPGVDRMSSAWLIRRFIDPQARFGFVNDRKAVPSEGIPFDMFGVEFSHHGDHCTFETLCAVFGIRSAAVERIAAVVHDLDLKDQRFGAPEAVTIGRLLDGLQLAHADDQALLTQGMDVFEALYRSFERAARSPGPRPVARRRSADAPSRRTRKKK